MIVKKDQFEDQYEAIELLIELGIILTDQKNLKKTVCLVLVLHSVWFLCVIKVQYEDRFASLHYHSAIIFVKA